MLITSLLIWKYFNNNLALIFPYCSRLFVHSWITSGIPSKSVRLTAVFSASNICAINTQTGPPHDTPIKETLPHIVIDLSFCKQTVIYWLMYK